MSDLRTQLLADEIFARLQGTTDGHCARVDFLERAEVTSICRYMMHSSREPNLVIHVLIPRSGDTQHDPLFITTDEAVEIRNRKQVRLCLFVPSDLVDAAYSSLANSFSLIDGRTLYETVLKREIKRLPQDAQKVLRFVSHGTLQASYEQRLDFAVTALTHKTDDDSLGLELWRVGLVADARLDFAEHLTSNRNNALALSHPTRPDATARERIQSLKTDKDTANVLGRFFRGRAMNDVSRWSQALAEEGKLTFDRWVFRETDHSDIRLVKVKPFIDAKGFVESSSRLKQLDEANGSLQAICGPKGTMVVKWSCEPEKPQNLSGWSVRILPSDTEYELAEDSDYVEPKIPRIPSHRRSVTIKLDIEEDEIPHCPVCVRVAPLDATGNEIIDEETGAVIDDRGTEFFLMKDALDTPPPGRESRSTVPTLSFGRLEIAMGMPDGQILDEGTQPLWTPKELMYFSLAFPNRNVLNIGLCETLLELERQVRDNPRNGGCFTLFVDEIRPVNVGQISLYALQYGNHTAWTSFWKAREAFFNRLKKMSPRDTIETVEWTLELANMALRYAQSYQALLDELMKSRCEHDEMLEVLSVDSLLIQVEGRKNTQEEAIVILPTHPLRVAWFAGYTQLLRNWEEYLSGLPKRERKRNIDREALRLLAPTNVPPFAYHAASKQSFLFFQNIRLYHGVALPADVADPYRRYGDIAFILGSVYEQSGIGDVQPEHLKEHLERFYISHPYAKTLVTTLVNPDRGDFFAEAVRKFISESISEDQDEEHFIPSFHITAYMPDDHKSNLKALEQILQRLDQQRDHVTDYFLPGLSTTVRPISQLGRKTPEAHLALVSDLTQPSIVVGSQEQNGIEARLEMSSFSLYGLITRFIPQFTTDEQGLLWYYRIIPEGVKKPEAHPVGPRFSETLVELHQSILDAQGYLANRRNDVYPMLEVRIEKDRGTLLEHLHTNTNWVITMDRFFALDYYDSPHEPELRTLAQKYVLDYSPESLEGFGHRMMVTTAWHEEIEALLARAMADLGFNSVDQSVSQLLHYLKTVSGRLALQALESPNSAAEAVGLGVVTAWLQKKGRLKEAILIPVDIYPRLFSLDGSGKSQQGERRCDMVLISLRRNIVDATFIEVKWRKGTVPLQELATDMALQMEGSAQAMYNRFFNEKRVDGILQRSYLANVLRFYFERSRRYKLFEPDAEKSFIEQLARLEKTNLEFRQHYEGYIVNLEGPQRKQPLIIETQTEEKAKIRVLTAKDFQDVDAAEFLSLLNRSTDVDEVQSLFVEVENRSDSNNAEDVLVGNTLFVDGGENETKGYPAENMSNGDVDIQVQPPIDEIKIPLGESSGEPVEWMPSTKGSPHLFILGIPGQGKSWTITRILNELGRQQVPTLVLDFHGQFADSQSSFVQTMHPTVVDTAQGLPFSPFECTLDNGSGGWMATSYALAEIFANVTGMGIMQRDLIFMALQDAYKAHGFVDEEAVDRDYPTPGEVLKRIEKKEQERHINNVAARCRPLLEMNLFQPIKDAPDMLTTIRQGLVIDLHNLYAEELQIAAGAFVLRKLYKDMFHWGNTNRLRLAIVLDEAHRLAKDVTLPKLMKEGRKFGIAVIVASQGINDFHQDILGNAGTKVIFRVNYPDSKKVAGFIRGHSGQDLASRIAQLKVGTAYVQTPEMAYGSVVHMYPLE